jgi:hypothetical protein
MISNCNSEIAFFGREIHNAARSEYFTGLGRLLILLHMGLERKVDFMRVSLEASTV